MYTIICVCILMSGCVFVHGGSASEVETKDIVWRKHIFHPVPFALRTALLNLCRDVCMWAYQPSAEPEILISFPAEPASSPGEEEITCMPPSCI